MSIEKKNSANLLVKDKISADFINAKRAKIAQKISKNVKIDGFRKGKVPLSVVESRYKEQITQDSQNEALNECIKTALESEKIAQNSVIGTAIFSKFEIKDDGAIEFEAKLGIMPDFSLDDLEAQVPKLNLKNIAKKDIDARLEVFAKNSGELKEVDKKIENGVVANIDFEGFIDGSAFEGGSAKGYDLEIGSKNFIEGFEDGLIGLKKGDEKSLNLTFPKDYAAHLADKKVEFKVKINAIKERESAKIDDNLAKMVLSNNAEAKLEDLEAFVKTQLESEAKNNAFNEAKPILVDNLIANIAFDLPENIIEQEMDIIFRNALQSLKEDELKELQSDREKAKAKRESFKGEAEKSVRLTFIVDSYSKAHNIAVSDNELYQMLYYEAMMRGSNPKDLAEFYEQNNMFPAIKMTILENKVLNHILEAKLAKDSSKGAKDSGESSDSKADSKDSKTDSKPKKRESKAKDSSDSSK